MLFLLQILFHRNYRNYFFFFAISSINFNSLVIFQAFKQKNITEVSLLSNPLTSQIMKKLIKILGYYLNDLQA